MATTMKEQSSDIEAWAAIDEPEGENTTPHVPVMAAEEPLEAQYELYDLRASYNMSLFHKQFANY